MESATRGYHSIVARADLLFSLAAAGSQSDEQRVREVLALIVEEERAKHHHVLADKLENLLKQSERIEATGAGAPRAFPDGLLVEVTPNRSLDELVFGRELRDDIFELVEEQQRADVLRSHGLEPRNRLLLAGPPGNGKTSLAEAIAGELLAPFMLVRQDAIISSFLGETAERLRTVFDYVKTRRCVLLIDEFDALAKERGDIHEVGEVKRVVSALLQQIDDLPSYVVVVVATNHPELLDRAVWRRFQLRLELDRPDESARYMWFDRFIRTQGVGKCVSAERLAREFEGANYSDLEDFCADVLRRLVLDIDESPCATVKRRLAVWQRKFQRP